MPLISIQVRLLKHLSLLWHHHLPIEVLLKSKLLVHSNLVLLRHLNRLYSLLHLLQFHVHLSQLSILSVSFLRVVDSFPLKLLSFVRQHDVLIPQAIHLLDQHLFLQLSLSPHVLCLLNGISHRLLPLDLDIFDLLRLVLELLSRQCLHLLKLLVKTLRMLLKFLVESAKITDFMLKVFFILRQLLEVSKHTLVVLSKLGALLVLHYQRLLQLEVLFFSLLKHLVQPLNAQVVLCYDAVLLLLKILCEVANGLRVAVHHLDHFELMLGVIQSELLAQLLLSDLALGDLLVFLAEKGV